MCLELDPILESILNDVHSNINNISADHKTPSVIKICIALLSNTYQWLEHVRLPSSIERAALINSKLSKVEKNFIASLQSEKNVQLEHEAAKTFITKNIIEKLKHVKEAIANQKLVVLDLMKAKGNYKDIELEDELLKLMIDQANSLLVLLRNKKIDSGKLIEVVHLYESHEKLLSAMSRRLTDLVIRAGFVPTPALLSRLVQEITHDDSLKFAFELGNIWKTAKAKEENAREQYINEAMDILFEKNQETLNQLLTQSMIHSISDDIQHSKQQIKETILSEYLNLPNEIRQTFEIFQNGIYYIAELESNQLLADLHLNKRPLNEIQIALRALQKKWTDSQYVKERICKILEQDWKIENSNLSHLFAQYKAAA